MSVGPGELLMLVVIVAIIFSASRMSSLGNALGKFVYSFKKASHGDAFIDIGPAKLERDANEVKTIDTSAKK
jgi:sec-independent protein translocase protein TatA